ncbi:hypothetical protein [Rhizobium sp. BG4]|uniref:hypothetical protein n=1 Tax=Rhizobium sp. BG4 TaxID=2613770 RepID=UPI00193E9B8C|nr:hypothetical protein [Rhizobium sp. BG4]QRM44768.1 hypothetical protein F2982_15765 [Rhizobium sp. BG4]
MSAIYEPVKTISRRPSDVGFMVSALTIYRIALIAVAAALSYEFEFCMFVIGYFLTQAAFALFMKHNWPTWDPRRNKFSSGSRVPFDTLDDMRWVWRGAWFHRYLMQEKDL